MRAGTAPCRVRGQGQAIPQGKNPRDTEVLFPCTREPKRSWERGQGFPSPQRPHTTSRVLLPPPRGTVSVGGDWTGLWMWPPTQARTQSPDTAALITIPSPESASHSWTHELS